jgi:hypothetical protein
METPLPAAPVVAVLGRLVVVELADGWALEVACLPYVTAARVLVDGREVRRVQVSRC